MELKGLFSLVLPLCALLPAPTESATIALNAGYSRSRIHREGTSSVATQYMQKLYEEQAGGDMPTVLCFADTDVLAGNYREKTPSDSDCTAATRYRFSVGALLQRTEEIARAVLRAYLQVRREALPDGKSAEGEVTVTARLHDPDRNTTSESVWVGAYPVSLDPESSGWMEMDVTQAGLHSDFKENSQLELEITLNLRTECQSGASRPVAYFVDPAGFQSSARRERYSNVQPLLVMYLDDKQKTHTENLFQFGDWKGHEGEIKRSPVAKQSQTELCERKPYIFNFREDLGLDFILQPRSVDFGRCSGTCFSSSSPTLRKLILSKHQMEPLGSGDDEEPIASEASCQPAGYQSIEVLMRLNGVLVILSLQDITVTDCTCSCGQTGYIV